MLGIDTAQFETGLKAARSSLSGFGATVAKAGVAAAAGFVSTGAAISVAVKHTIDQADALGKSAQKIGIPVEQLSALRHAADLSGVSMEGLEKGVAKLSRAMVEAAAKPTSEAANAFKALGVNAVDPTTGKLRSSIEVIGDVAGKFEGLKDGAGKTAVAMALFGKSGADLIPLLNSGKTGLQEMMNEAAALGIVIDTQTAKSAEAFNDNLTRLGKVKDGIILKITAGMVPALENLSANMVRVAKDGDALRATGEAIGNMLVGMFSGIERVSVAWQRLGVEWKALREFMQTDIFSGKVSENWNKFIAAGEETKRVLENLKITQETAHLADAFGEIGNKAAGAVPKLKDFNFAAMAGKTALNQYLDSVRKAREGQAAQAAGFGQAAGAAEAYKVVLQGLAVAKAAGQPVDQARLTQLYQEAFATQDLAQKLAGLQLTMQNMMPWEIYQQALLNNQILFEAGKISAETFARANEAAADSAGVSWKVASTSLAGSFGEIGQAMAGMSSNWARLAKVGQAIGASVAFINAYVAASEAFAKTPFPGNIAIAGGVLAKGLAMVAAIRGASIPSAAMGGAFTVPGGIGGGDRVRAMIDIEPGELVEVSSNRPGGYQSGGAGRGGTIVVEGVRDDYWYSGKQLRKFVEAYNEQAGELRLATA